ncbi:hypothetical protein RN001_013322 [Aquatica leii]|uniref:Uncharacterized protein n=1 Tax=Aquatica leii TaxID=1421715 RepID=A0AAN7SCC4_9COLE|nr:hypothetical protein RN001_013322 [Aquatica leii]
MIFQLTSVLFLSACLNQVAYFEVTNLGLDKGDLICIPKLNITIDQIYAIVNKINVINPDDEFAKKYVRCWMFAQGITDGEGNLNLDVYKIWYTTSGYVYMRKDNVEKYKIEDRGINFDKAVMDCQTQLGFTLNVKEKEPHLYICMMNSIGAL